MLGGLRNNSMVENLLGLSPKSFGSFPILEVSCVKAWRGFAGMLISMRFSGPSGHVEMKQSLRTEFGRDHGLG